MNTEKITVETSVKGPIERVWEYFTDPGHITHWYHATDDWHAPSAENDLREGGTFRTTMAAKDGSHSFDFEGEYTIVKKYERIEFRLLDNRMVAITFSKQGDEIRITETFEAESQNSLELQRLGWQSILDHFKKYAESQ